MRSRLAALLLALIPLGPTLLTGSIAPPMP